MIADLLARLSPDTLRALVRPLATAREAYRPRLATTTSSTAMHTEVEHFVTHMLNRRYTNDPSVGWPALEVERVTEELLLRGIGRRGAMQLVYEGGIRKLLDTLTTTLEQHALTAHLDVGILLEVELLEPAAQLRLAEAYLDTFRGFAIELDHPAFVIIRWRDLLHHHAQLVLRR